MKRLVDGGVSLLNVLVVLVVGTGFVTVLLNREESALSQLQTASDRTQARALAVGGVASVETALKRDFETQPQADHLFEPWALALQDPIYFEFGSFEVSVKDARGRFDINSLKDGPLNEPALLSSLLSVLDLPKALGIYLQRIVRRHGPFDRIDQVLDYGVNSTDLDRLRPHVTALPRRGAININTASPELLIALFGDGPKTGVLTTRRAVKGYLEPGDLKALGLVLPILADFRSDAFDVRVLANVGTARANLIWRLVRNPKSGEVTRYPQ